MQPVKHAVISAAGLGSRLELNMPKCLVEVGPRRIVDYQLDLLKEIEDVRIVVGFMEDKVIDHVRNYRDDVIFVRNPDYRNTSNSYSLHLATRDLKEPFLAIDGDLLIEPASFRAFLSECNGNGSVVGITETKTEEAVFAELDATEQQVVGFSTEVRQPFEWCGVAYLKDVPVAKNTGFVFREIEKHLPLKSCRIACHEIDTPDDLNNALASLSLYTATS